MNRDRMPDAYAYEDSRMQHSSSGMLPFLLGAAAGVAVALLYSPGPGAENRTRLKDGARRLRETAGEKLGEARHIVEDGASAVREAVDGGREVVRESVAAGRETLNKLRETSSTAGTTGTPGSNPNRTI
jgi:gas vesicle protein